MTDILRLRIMARKSVFDGGKFEGLSVQQIIDMGRQDYLVYQYYRYCKISFIDDILEEIGITAEYRIKKPGSNLEMYRKWGDNRWANMSVKDKSKEKSHRKKQKRMKFMIKNRQDNKTFTLKRMQAKNHGRI